MEGKLIVPLPHPPTHPKLTSRAVKRFGASRCSCIAGCRLVLLLKYRRQTDNEIAGHQVRNPHPQHTMLLSSSMWLKIQSAARSTLLF